jgi:transposase
MSSAKLYSSYRRSRVLGTVAVRVPYGRAKEDDIARQVMLGVVQTADALPIHHEVFAGNSAETHTLVPSIERVLSRFPIRRVVLVADRGLLSLDNLDAVQQIQVNGQALEFILAVPARRYSPPSHRCDDLRQT